MSLSLKTYFSYTNLSLPNFWILKYDIVKVVFEHTFRDQSERRIEQRHSKTKEWRPFLTATRRKDQKIWDKKYITVKKQTNYSYGTSTMSKVKCLQIVRLLMMIKTNINQNKNTVSQITFNNIDSKACTNRILLIIEKE